MGALLDRVAKEPAISRTQSLKPGMRTPAGEVPFLKELRREGGGGGFNTLGAGGVGGSGGGVGGTASSAGAAGTARKMKKAPPTVSPRGASMRQPANGGGGGGRGGGGGHMEVSPRSRMEASKAFEEQIGGQVKFAFADGGVGAGDDDGGGREGEYFNMRTPGGSMVTDRSRQNGATGHENTFFGSDA